MNAQQHWSQILRVALALTLLSCSATEETPEGLVGPGGKADGTGVSVVKIVLEDITGKSFRALNCGDEYDETRVKVTIGETVIPSAAISLRGATSRCRPKRPFKLKFDEKVKLNLFGKKENFKRVLLNASYIDPTLINNALVFDLARALGGLAPRTGFAELYQGGEYLGFYQIVEAVDGEFFDENEEHFGGVDLSDYFLYKATQHTRWGQGLQFRVEARNKPDGSFDAYHYYSNTESYRVFESKGKVDDPSDAVRDNLLWFLQQANPDDPSTVDAESFRVFHIVNSFAQNVDTYTKNYYLFLPKTRLPARLIFWDADATWGRNWDGNDSGMRDSPFGIAEDGGAFPARWIGRNGGQYYRDYKFLLEEGLFRTEKMLARVDSLRQALGAKVQRDLERWPREYGNQSFEAEVARARQFIQNHHGVVLNKVNGECARFNCMALSPSEAVRRAGEQPPPPPPVTGYQSPCGSDQRQVSGGPGAPVRLRATPGGAEVAQITTVSLVDLRPLGEVDARRACLGSSCYFWRRVARIDSAAPAQESWLAETDESGGLLGWLECHGGSPPPPPPGPTATGDEFDAGDVKPAAFSQAGYVSGTMASRWDVFADSDSWASSPGRQLRLEGGEQLLGCNQCSFGMARTFAVEGSKQARVKIRVTRGTGGWVEVLVNGAQVGAKLSQAGQSHEVVSPAVSGNVEVRVKVGTQNAATGIEAAVDFVRFE